MVAAAAATGEEEESSPLVVVSLPMPPPHQVDHLTTTTITWICHISQLALSGWLTLMRLTIRALPAVSLVT